MFDYKNASLEQIKSEWARIAILSNNYAFYTKKELHYLPEILGTTEQVLRFASGFINNKTWLIVATNERVLFINKGLFTGVEYISIQVTKITSVTAKEGWIFGQIIIADQSTKHTIKNISKKTIKPFITALQEQIHQSTTHDKTEEPEKIQRKQQDNLPRIDVETTIPKQHKKLSLMKKTLLTFASILILIFIIGNLGKKEEKTKNIAEQKESISLEKTYSNVLDSTLETKVQDNTVTVTVIANTPDGAIFIAHVKPLGSNSKPLTSAIVINSQEGSHTFTIPKTWGVCVLNVITNFAFDNPEIVQPDIIKELYGETGEKIINKNSSDNTTTFMYDTATPYPSAEKVKKYNLEKLEKNFNSLKRESQNIIKGIYFNEDNPRLVFVVVSDSWYSAPMYIKERFVEKYTPLVEVAFQRFPVYFGDRKNKNGIMVQYLDEFKKVVAEPKIFGGYTIQ